MRWTTLTLLTTACAFAATTATAEISSRVLATFPPGSFLENLVVGQSGETVFTSYFDRELLVLGTSGTLTSLARLPAHPVGIVEAEDGYVVTAHGTAFTEGPVFTQTQQILLLDADGVLQATTPAPEALFLNGMAQLSQGGVLVADSLAGTIWHYDTTSRAVTPWLQHALLAQDPDGPAAVPGANGLKTDAGRLLISNSSRGALYQVTLGADGQAASDPGLIAQTGPIDDFWVDGDRIIFTTHGDALKVLEPDGTINTLMAKGCDGCTSVARRGDAYIVLTTGGLLEGHGKPARVLEIPAH